MPTRISPLMPDPEPATPIHAADCAPLIAQARLQTPLGEMTAARSAAGLAGLWFDAQRHHPGPLALPQEDGQRLFRTLQAWLDAYFRGQVMPLALPLAPRGTPFQRAVWQQLLQIPARQPASYGGLAARLGRPQAARAVGAAVGRNPISILIPCHRVLGANGSLTGYAGGLARKQALLALEGGAA
jgi:methylated-DNA-[protein]-cysteine S-methyltransferase